MHKKTDKLIIWLSYRRRKWAFLEHNVIEITIMNMDVKQYTKACR